MGFRIGRRLGCALLLVAPACLHGSAGRYFSVGHRSWDWCLERAPSAPGDRAEEFVMRAPGCSEELFSLEVTKPGRRALPERAVAQAEPAQGWAQEFRWREQDGALCRALSEPTADGKRSVVVTYCHTDGSTRQLADDAIAELVVH